MKKVLMYILMTLILSTFGYATTTLIDDFGRVNSSDVGISNLSVLWIETNKTTNLKVNLSNHSLLLDKTASSAGYLGGACHYLSDRNLFEINFSTHANGENAQPILAVSMNYGSKYGNISCVPGTQDCYGFTFGFKWGANNYIYWEDSKTSSSISFPAMVSAVTYNYKIRYNNSRISFMRWVKGGVVPTTFNATLQYDHNNTGNYLCFGLGDNSASLGRFWVDDIYIKTPEINNCSSGSPTLNISTLFENNNSPVVTNFSMTINYSTYDGATETFSYKNVTGNNHTFCIDPDYSALISDFQIEYIYGSTYYSYFQNEINLSDYTKLINLYVTSGTTLVSFNVKDTNGNNLEDAYITIEKYDVGTNTYKVVEVLKTDGSGNAIGNLVLNINWYRFSISYDSITRLVDGPTLVTSTTKNFVINILGDDWYDSYEELNGITYSLVFNDTTNNFRLEYADPNLVASNICMKVTNTNNTILTIQNDSCMTTSPTGVILHKIVPENGTIYIATAYAIINGNTFPLDVLEKNYLTEWVFYDDDNHYGVYVTFLFVLAMMMLGIWSPTIAIFLGLGGLFVARIIGFYYMSWPMFVGLMILGTITAYKIGKAK